MAVASSHFRMEVDPAPVQRGAAASPATSSTTPEWCSDGEDEQDNQYEYYFDPDRGLDFKFPAGSRAAQDPDHRRALVREGEARMAREFRFTEPDPFFDPTADDLDDSWVQARVFPGSAASGVKQRTSDALLSCPCCFTMVCVDCQKVDEACNEWRAVEVQNCTIDRTKLFFYDDARARAGAPHRRDRKKTHWSRAATAGDSEEDSSDGDESDGQADSGLLAQDPLVEVDASIVEGQRVPSEDLFHALRCELCGCQVGVVDLNEIYHLFKVVPSNA